MKYINVRQLTRNLKEASIELPARVTRNGLPIFDIVSVGGEKISEKKILENFVEPAQVPFVKCSYFQCREEATATGKTWSDAEGEMVDSPMCQKHAVQGRNLARG